MSKEQKDTNVVITETTKTAILDSVVTMESLNLSPVSSGVPMPVVQPPKDTVQNSTSVADSE
jgi:hypothetical protein